MNISTNNNNNSKFLSVIAMMAVFIAIFVPTTEAAGARGSVRRRMSNEKKDNRVLKSTKADSTPMTTSATANSNPVTTPTGPSPTPDTTGNSVFAWEARCASQSNSLDNCVAGTDTAKMICKQCIIGIAQLNTVSMSGLNSCSNDAINGGLCNDCHDQVLNFYNCGAGTSLGVPAANPTSSSINQELTSGVEVQLVTSSSVMAEYAPVESCPFAMPESGDLCFTQGYKYLQCYYSGNMNCSCRDENPFYLCVEKSTVV